MEALAWSPDGNQIVTGSISGSIIVWDAATLLEINQFPANVHYKPDAYNIPDLTLSFVRDLTFGSDGSLQTVSGDGTIRRLSLDGRLIEEIQIGQLTTAAWSPYGARLAIQGLADPSLPTTSASSNSLLQIVTPYASLEYLQSLTQVCVRVTSLEQVLPPVTDLTILPKFTTQIEALSDDQIPPGCKADLLAVAQAIQATE
ncbi:MAG: WD40 repeat domain-containing protein [Anaerolineae bacterium]|nr:WD40 repeat domain-containing protein [Anaerolineae bacterium]